MGDLVVGLVKEIVEEVEVWLVVRVADRLAIITKLDTTTTSGIVGNLGGITNGRTVFEIELSLTTSRGLRVLTAVDGLNLEVVANQLGGVLLVESLGILVVAVLLEVASNSEADVGGVAGSLVLNVVKLLQALGRDALGASSSSVDSALVDGSLTGRGGLDLAVGVHEVGNGVDEANGILELLGNAVLLGTDEALVVEEGVALEVCLKQLAGLSDSRLDVDEVILLGSLGQAVLLEPGENLVDISLVRSTQSLDFLAGQVLGTGGGSNLSSAGVTQSNGELVVVAVRSSQSFSLGPTFGQRCNLLKDHATRRGAGKQRGQNEQLHPECVLD